MKGRLVLFSVSIPGVDPNARDDQTYRPPPITGPGTETGFARASVLAAPTNAIPIARRSNIVRTPKFFRQRKPILQMPPEFLIFIRQTASGSSRVFREANYATGRRRSVDGGKHFCDQAAACPSASCRTPSLRHRLRRIGSARLASEAEASCVIVRNVYRQQPQTRCGMTFRTVEGDEPRQRVRSDGPRTSLKTSCMKVF